MNSKFYVSLEAARLLREKGYDIKRDFLTPVYAENGCLYWSNHEDLSDKIPAITKAEAIDWLESKGVIVEFQYYQEFSAWSYAIYCICYMSSDEEFPTRLEAEDAAIIKALELL
jgi:hypothetical protein